MNTKTGFFFITTSGGPTCIPGIKTSSGICLISRQSNTYITSGLLLIFALLVLLLFWNYLLNRLRSTDRINIESLKTENEKLGYSIKKLTERNEYVESEMHHRIKNNLQILSSLINGQLSFANDKNGLEILYQTKYRLFALSLVHQKLFQHASSAVIEMSCCIKELADFLIDEFNCGKRVQFEMNLVSLKVDPTVAFAIQALFIISITWSLLAIQKKLPELSKIDQQSWIYLIAAGVLTTLSSLFQFNALKLGDAAIVSSIERLSLVFAIILAVLFLREQLNWKIILGAGLMICGALVITLSSESK
ncbi:MAG: hypothetical protein EOP48_13210 [Sphingobacteriales bacterium]|nr:MAG: hypothetical protein EOP48_13210 [Sphingobacteriales bacterium]